LGIGVLVGRATGNGAGDGAARHQAEAVIATAAGDVLDAGKGRAVEAADTQTVNHPEVLDVGAHQRVLRAADVGDAERYAADHSGTGRVGVDPVDIDSGAADHALDAHEQDVAHRTRAGAVQHPVGVEVGPEDRVVTRAAEDLAVDDDLAEQPDPDNSTRGSIASRLTAGLRRASRPRVLCRAARDWVRREAI
jgi:hypothetical protein